MRELEEVLGRVDNVIEVYESGQWQSIDNLREILRDITTANYHLSKHSIEAYQKHNAFMFNFEGTSARAKVAADENVPELRMVRKIMEAVDHVIWSIRSEISIIKNEQ